MKKTLLAFFGILLSLCLHAQSPASGKEADKILGLWQTGSGKGRILITAYSDKKIKDLAQEAGVDIFINKPFLLDDILEAVASLTNDNTKRTEINLTNKT